MVNKLLVCPQRDCNAEIYKKDKSDYHVEIKLLYHCYKKTHFGALLKFNVEVNFFTSL